jgi:hypothetical protein
MIIIKAVLLINVAPGEIVGSQEAKSMALKDKCPWNFLTLRKVLHLEKHFQWERVIWLHRQHNTTRHLFPTIIIVSTSLCSNDRRSCVTRRAECGRVILTYNSYQLLDVVHCCLVYSFHRMISCPYYSFHQAVYVSIPAMRDS